MLGWLRTWPNIDVAVYIGLLTYDVTFLPDSWSQSSFYSLATIYSLTETKIETVINIISLSETERKTEMICKTETKYKWKSERNSTENEIDFKTRMVIWNFNKLGFDLVTNSRAINFRIYHTNIEAVQVSVEETAAVGFSRQPQSHEHLCHDASPDWPLPAWTSGM